MQKIPESFVKKFRDELSTVATLNVPDGHVWRVGLKRADNKLWFHDGWQEFVERYAIRVGYFLVFRYEGNSAFSVYIFNLTTSEINYQSNAISSSEAMYRKRYKLFEEIEDEDYAEFLGSSPRCVAPDSLKNKYYAEYADQLTPGKGFSPPLLQNLFNGSKLKNCINWSNEGNLHPGKVAGSLYAGNQSTRDIGVQFNVVDIKKPVDEVKLHNSEENVQRIKKSMKKKRKIEPSKLLKLVYFIFGDAQLVEFILSC